MRATKHNSRGVKGSSRGYTANHNDRNFKYQDAEHIKTDKVQTNIYWNWTSVKEYKHTDKGISFDEAEARYYERFRHQWEAQCERNEKARHSERNKTFDDWRNSKRYCPEEVYMQVGNHEKHIDNATTYKIMRDYIAFERQFAREHNNCCQILDYAFHFDEDVPQLHYRRVWQSKNADGRFEIGQNKALETSGLELPYPDEPISKTNNYKITYDKIMRDRFLDICESYGLEVTREPDKNAKHDMSKDDMLREKRRKTVKAVKRAQADYQNTSIKLSEAQEELQNAQMDINTLEEQKRALKSELERLESERNEVLQDKQAFARYQEFLKLKEEKKRRERNNRILQNGIDMANELESGSSKGMEL